MTKHHPYGGSTAARTIACPAWHNLAKDVPKYAGSSAAALGTALHAVLEKCLLDVDLDPSVFAGETIEGVYITADHVAEKIVPAIECFEDLMNQYDIDQYWVEVFSEVDWETGGTADFVGLSGDGKILVVADYKSGDGLMVDALDNKQGLFYAWCLFNDNKKRFEKAFENVEKIVIAIVQPSPRRAEFLDVWETDVGLLNLFALEYREAKAEVKAGTRSPCAGDHCKFCPVEAVCSSKKELVTKVERLHITEIQKTDIAAALNIATEVEQWIKAVRKMAFDAMTAGDIIDGYKLVDKRATRAWIDHDATLQKLKLMRRIKIKEATVEKMCSPAQIEKLCKAHKIDYKKEFEPMVSAVSSGMTLVKASDKRPSAIKADVQKQIADRFK